jgi:hypothetical protein
MFFFLSFEEIFGFFAYLDILEDLLVLSMFLRDSTRVAAN